MYLLAICISSSEKKCLVRVFAYLKIQKKFKLYEFFILRQKYSKGSGSTTYIPNMKVKRQS